jgi:hypothetical protein
MRWITLYEPKGFMVEREYELLHMGRGFDAGSVMILADEIFDKIKVLENKGIPAIEDGGGLARGLFANNDVTKVYGRVFRQRRRFHCGIVSIGMLSQYVDRLILGVHSRTNYVPELPRHFRAQHVYVFSDGIEEGGWEGFVFSGYPLDADLCFNVAKGFTCHSNCSTLAFHLSIFPAACFCASW